MIRAQESMGSDMSQSALNAYAEDMDIRIDYKRMGFSE